MERVHVLSPITNDRAQLRDAIRQSEFGDGTGLYEAVDFVINQQLRTMQGRKAVVLFTDGVDTTSRRATYQSTVADTEEIDSSACHDALDRRRNGEAWGFDDILRALGETLIRQNQLGNYGYLR